MKKSKRANRSELPAAYRDADMSVPKSINPDGLYAVSIWPATHGIGAPGGYLQQDFLFRPKDNLLIDCGRLLEIETELHPEMGSWLSGEKVPQYDPEGLEGIRKIVATEVPFEDAQRILASFDALEAQRNEFEIARNAFCSSLGEIWKLFHPEPIAVMIVQECDEFRACAGGIHGQVLATGKTALEVERTLGLVDEHFNPVECFPPKYELQGVVTRITKTVGRLTEDDDLSASSAAGIPAEGDSESNREKKYRIFEALDKITPGLWTTDLATVTSPDDGKTGWWIVEGLRHHVHVRASSAAEAIRKADETGDVDITWEVPTATFLGTDLPDVF